MIRINFKELKFPDPFARECILSGGSKRGPDVYLRKQWAGTPLERHLPEGEYYLPPEDINDPAKVEAFLKSISESSKPKIVRGCVLPNGEYPGDFGGAVDLIPSYEDVTTKGRLDCSVKGIIKFAKEEKVKKYLSWDGTNSCPLVCILVEDYYKSTNHKFSIIEHPSMDNIYIAESAGSLRVLQGIYEDEKYLCGNDDSSFYREGIEAYKLVKDSGLIPEGYTFHIEYGYDDDYNLKIFQVRLFRKKEPRADFDIPPEVNCQADDFHSFGITAKDGIEIDIGELSEFGIAKLTGKSKAAYSLYIAFDKHSPDIGLVPHNLTTFVGNVHSKTFLEHGYFRYLQRADIGLVVFDQNLIFKTSSGTAKVKLFSNGIRGGFNFV